MKLFLGNDDFSLDTFILNCSSILEGEKIMYQEFKKYEDEDDPPISFDEYIKEYNPTIEILYSGKKGIVKRIIQYS